LLHITLVIARRISDFFKHFEGSKGVRRAVSLIRNILTAPSG